MHQILGREWCELIQRCKDILNRWRRKFIHPKLLSYIRIINEILRNLRFFFFSGSPQNLELLAGKLSP